MALGESIPEKSPPRTDVVNGDRARRDSQDLDLEGVARARTLDGDGAGRRGQHPRLLPRVPGPLVRIPRLYDQLFAGANCDCGLELRIQYRRERVAAETLHRLLPTLVTALAASPWSAQRPTRPDRRARPVCRPSRLGRRAVSNCIRRGHSANPTALR